MNADAMVLDALVEAIASGEAIPPERFGALSSGARERSLARDLAVIATIAEASQRWALAAGDGPPVRIGRFELSAPLGAGGMGAVWAARDTILERTVAIKFLRPHLAGDARYRQRFLREGRAAARLRHRGICAIYEIGETTEGLSLVQRGQALPLAPGTPYAAIEFIRGETLQSRLRRGGSMSRRDVLRIATEAADALAAAHDAGIVHRDIKPANIMLGADGRVVILDFGLAGIDSSIEPGARSGDGAWPGDDSLTMAGDVVGTVAYMSPEQARGEPLDARTDVFSLGLVLWELLAGTAIDTQGTTGRKTAITRRAACTELVPDLPPVAKRWRRLLDRCVAADAADRYASARELLSDLHAFARWPRRAVIGPVIGGLTLAGFGLGAWLFTSPRPAVPQPEPVQTQLTSNPPETAVHTAAISPDGQYLAFADPTGTYVRVIRTGETRRILAAETLDVTSVEWSPDGRRLAASAISPNAQGVGIWTMSPDGGGLRQLRRNAIACPISPDGSRMLFINLELRSQDFIQAGIWTMGTDGEAAHPLLPKLAGNAGYQSVAWSPDGGKVLFVSDGEEDGVRTATLGIVDASGGPPHVILSDPRLLSTSCSSNASWLPGGKILYTRSEPPPNQGASNFWELRIDPVTHEALGEPNRITNWADGCVTNVDAPADGSHLAFLKQRKQADVYLGELRDGGDRLENIRRLTLDDRDDFLDAWAPDGRSLYFASNRQGTFDLFKQGVDDATAEVVVQGPDGERKAKLSPDGSLLLYQAQPPGPDAGPAPLLRVPVAGGRPEVVVSGEDIAGFNCPRVSTAPCVLKEYRAGELFFYRLDPVHGKGAEIGRLRTGFPVWNLSSDGSKIALIGDESSGAAWNGILSMSVADGTLTNLHVRGLAFPNDLAWSSDGNSLFFTELDASAASPGWRVVHVDGKGNAHVLWQSRIVWGLFSDPSPSPDGRYLAFGQVGFESNAWRLENY